MQMDRNKQSYAKKPNRISMSEINEKNALITDRRIARIKTKKQKNKCGCSATMSFTARLTCTCMFARVASKIYAFMFGSFRLIDHSRIFIV